MCVQLWKIRRFSPPTAHRPLQHVIRFYWARILQRLGVPAAHFGYVFNMLSTFLCILQHYRMCQSAAAMLSFASDSIYVCVFVRVCMWDAVTLTVNAVRQVTNVHINGCVKNVAES